MELIKGYFPGLSALQQKQFGSLLPLYNEWNSKVNLISRKDLDNLYKRHVLHSLAIAKFFQFVPGSRILDLGTGGGFPGIPLAIMFPKVNFILIDARAKKINAVLDIIDRLGLSNVEAFHHRAEEYKGSFDFIVSRAVARIRKVWDWSFLLISLDQKNPTPNGLIVFKGGDFKDELKELPKRSYYEIEEISRVFQEIEFEEKCLVYIQR